MVVNVRKRAGSSRSRGAAFVFGIKSVSIDRLTATLKRQRFAVKPKSATAVRDAWAAPARELATNASERSSRDVFDIFKYWSETGSLYDKVSAADTVRALTLVVMDFRCSLQPRPDLEHSWRGLMQLLTAHQRAGVVALVDDQDVEAAAWVRTHGADEVLQATEADQPNETMFRVDVAVHQGTARAAALAPVREERAAALAPAEREAALVRVKAMIALQSTANQDATPGLSALQVIAPDLRTAEGFLDANLIAQRLGVSRSRVAAAIDESRQRVSNKPASAALQAALEPMARVIAALDAALPPEQIRSWLQSAHRALGDVPPMELILSGQAERVALLLETAVRGGS